MQYYISLYFKVTFCVVQSFLVTIQPKLWFFLLWLWLGLQMSWQTLINVGFSSAHIWIRTNIFYSNVILQKLFSFCDVILTTLTHTYISLDCYFFWVFCHSKATRNRAMQIQSPPPAASKSSQIWSFYLQKEPTLLPTHSVLSQEPTVRNREGLIPTSPQMPQTRRPQIPVLLKGNCENRAHAWQGWNVEALITNILSMFLQIVQVSCDFS